MLEDDNLNGHNFKLDDNDEIMLDSFELVGVDSLSDIDEDNVIYVYLDAASEITRIDVGTETVSGEITKINSAGDTFTIDGKAYSLAEDPAGTAYYGGTLTAGDEVKLILDAAGDIYDVDSISSANTYAMVVAVDNGVPGAFGSDPEILLVLADGTNKVFKADAKAIDDGTGAIINETTLVWNNGVAGDPVNEGALIKYNVNADGEINAITALTELDGTTASKLSKTGYYKGAKVKSDAVILVYDGTVAFNFGGAASYFAAAINEDDFDVTTLDKILDTDIAAYYTKNSSGLIDFMVIDSAAIVSDEVYGIVTGSGTNNSDAGFYVTLLIDGAESTVDASADYSALRANTTNGHIVVEVSYDTKGVVSLKNVETATPVLTAVGTAAPTSPATTFKLSINSNNVVARDTSGDITGSGSFDVTAAGFTLADDVAIYKLDGSKYVKGTMSDLKSNLTSAKFFDTGKAADQDLIVDIVLISK